MELSTEARAHITKKIVGILDVLRDPKYPDIVATDAVIELYVAGFKDGYAKADSLLKQIISDVTKIVVAHQTQDAVGVKAALDEFVERRVVIINDGAKPSFTH